MPSSAQIPFDWNLSAYSVQSANLICFTAQEEGNVEYKHNFEELVSHCRSSFCHFFTCPLPQCQTGTQVSNSYNSSNLGNPADGTYTTQHKSRNLAEHTKVPDMDLRVVRESLFQKLYIQVVMRGASWWRGV